MVLPETTKAGVDLVLAPVVVNRDLLLLLEYGLVFGLLADDNMFLASWLRRRWAADDLEECWSEYGRHERDGSFVRG